MTVIKSIFKHRFFNIPYKTENTTIQLQPQAINLIKQMGFTIEEATIERSQISNIEVKLKLGVSDIIAAVIELLMFLVFLPQMNLGTVCILLASVVSFWSAVSYRVIVRYRGGFAYEIPVASRSNADEICRMIKENPQYETQIGMGDYIFMESSSVEMFRYASLAIVIMIFVMRVAEMVN